MALSPHPPPFARRPPAVRQTGNGSGLFSGLLLGLVLALLYVKFGWSLPAWVKPVESAFARVTDLVVSLAVDRNDFAELQREISYQLYGDGYVELDNRVDGFITEEVVWQARIKPALQQLQQQLKALARTRQRGELVALDSHLEQLIEQLPLQRAADRLLLRRYLTQRFPGLDSKAIGEQLTQLSLAELLQLRAPYARIRLAVPLPAATRVVVLDSAGQPLKTLLDAELPAAQLRLYWFYTDEQGRRVKPQPYRYQVWMDGELHRTASLAEAGALWQ